MKVLDFIYQHKIVAISRGVYGDDLIKAVKEVQKGGIKLLEITFDQQDENHLEKTSSSIAAVKEQFGSDICVGAGTVMSIEQVNCAADAGADFALAPNTDIKVLHEMKRLDLVAVPGALTPSEIAAAHNEGADIVKLFPASILGLDYVKAITAPINHIPLMAVGGVSTENAGAFLEKGFMSIGVGSHIINAKKIASGDFSGIESAARAFVQAAEKNLF